MNALPDFPRLDSPARCAALWSDFPEKAVGLWATGFPRQNVDVLWRLRKELIKLGVPVIFFFTESAKPMLRTVLMAESGEEERIYQLDDAVIFFSLNFIPVLVTNDYINFYQLLHIRFRKLPQKIVLLQHTATSGISTLNMYCDYLCITKPLEQKWLFTKFPPQFTIHHNEYLTILPTGYPKLDLLLEARKLNYKNKADPIFLFFIGDIFVLRQRLYVAKGPQTALTDEFLHAWRELAKSLLNAWPRGTVVFRPMAASRETPEIQKLAAYISTDSRLILDLNDDNIHWLSRADYFIVDISTALENWIFSSLKPAIILEYGDNVSAGSFQMGTFKSTPQHMADAVKMLQAEEAGWHTRLLEQRRTSHPFVGHVFERLSAMLARIATGTGTPAWLHEQKVNAVCTTLADTLRFTGWFCSRENPYLGQFRHYWPLLQSLPGGRDCRVCLLLLKCGLVIYGGQSDPATVAPFLACILQNSLESCPPAWTSGVIKFCLKKNPALTRQVCALAHYTPYRPSGDMLKSRDMLKAVTEYTRKIRDFTMLSIWLDDVLNASAGTEAPQIWLLLMRRALLPDLLADHTLPDIALIIERGMNTALKRLPLTQSIGLLRHCLRKEPHMAATALLITATSHHVNRFAKKRALFFLLMECGQCVKALATVNDLAEKTPQHFSRPVLDKLNRLLPLAMKVPLPLRRYGARVLGLKKPLARKYWLAHRALCPK